MTTTARLKADYTYRDVIAVRDFLHRHPEVVPVLDEAGRMIPIFFGANPSLVLDGLTDPEEPDEQSLFALIQTRLEPDEALPLLDEFNDRWWRLASSTVGADIHFGLDYV